MKKVVFALLLLSGCAFQKMDKSLPLLRGQDIATAISYLGYPNSKEEMFGGTVYTWATNYNVSGVTPVTSYSQGTAKAYGSGGYAFGSYSGSTTTYVPTTTNYRCMLRLVANSNGTIISHQYEGNQGGCNSYANSLDDFRDDFTARTEAELSVADDDHIKVLDKSEVKAFHAEALARSKGTTTKQDSE